MTPLTYDSGLWLAELGWRDAWERMGAFEADEFPSDDYAQLGVVGGYCYLNASLIRLFGERAPGLSWQLIDEQFFGAQPGIPPYQEEPGDVRPDLTERIGATFGWALSVERLSDLTELIEDLRATKRLRDERPDLSAMSDGDLVARYRELIELHRNLFAHHLFALYMATVPLGIIQGVSTAVGRPDLLMVLIAGVGEVDSAAPSMALWELGRVVAAAPELQAAFGAGVTGLTDRLEASGSQAAQAFLSGFRVFQHDYGSRAERVGDPVADLGDPSRAGAVGHRSHEVGPAHCLAGRSPGEPGGGPRGRRGRAPRHGRSGSGDARTTRGGVAGRDRVAARPRADEDQQHPPHPRGPQDAARSSDGGWWIGVRSTPSRTSASCASLRWTDPSSTTHTPSPTTCAAAGPSTSTSRLGSRRSCSWATPDPATWPRRDDAVFEGLTSGASLQGIPGCAGVAEGRARVVLDSNDPSALDPGDVLVAPITDPSWTPLFVPAAAVVVDVGAPLSHAVIVSRELGIPCVVSATGATRSIPDGARVRVDGSTGVVTVL